MVAARQLTGGLLCSGNHLKNLVFRCLSFYDQMEAKNLIIP